MSSEYHASCILCPFKQVSNKHVELTQIVACSGLHQLQDLKRAGEFCTPGSALASGHHDWKQFLDAIAKKTTQKTPGRIALKLDT